MNKQSSLIIGILALLLLIPATSANMFARADDSLDTAENDSGGSSDSGNDNGNNDDVGSTDSSTTDSSTDSNRDGSSNSMDNSKTDSSNTDDTARENEIHNGDDNGNTNVDNEPSPKTTPQVDISPPQTDTSLKGDVAKRQSELIKQHGGFDDTLRDNTFDEGNGIITKDGTVIKNGQVVGHEKVNKHTNKIVQVTQLNTAIAINNTPFPLANFHFFPDWTFLPICGSVEDQLIGGNCWDNTRQVIVVTAGN